MSKESSDKSTTPTASSSAAPAVAENTTNPIVKETSQTSDATVNNGYRNMTHALVGDVRALKEERTRRETELARLRKEREEESARVEDLKRKAKEADKLKEQMSEMQAVFEEMKREKAQIYAKDMESVDDMFKTIEKEAAGDDNDRLMSSVNTFKNTLMEGAQDAFVGKPHNEAAFKTVRACASVLNCNATKAERLFKQTQEDEQKITEMKTELDKHKMENEKLMKELEEIKKKQQSVMNPVSHFKSSEENTEMPQEDDHSASKARMEITAQASNNTAASGFDQLFNNTKYGSWRNIPQNLTKEMMQIGNHNGPSSSSSNSRWG